MRSDPREPGDWVSKGGGRVALWVTGFTLLLALAVVQPTGQVESSTATKFLGHLAQDDRPLTQYTAFRRMYARNEKFNQEAWLDAWTILDERGFRYEIVSERGSDYARNKVLKAVLKGEQELIAAGRGEGSTFSAANYEFTDAAANEEGVRYVLLKPKRKDVLLVDGRLVLSEDATELLRVEGRLSKNPSFWTNSVNVARHYGRLDGVRVPVSTESVARIKFAGVAHLEVRYDYESINGRPVSLAARRILASLR
jgi:hypothetical protein